MKRFEIEFRASILVKSLKIELRALVHFLERYGTLIQVDLGLPSLKCQNNSESFMDHCNNCPIFRFFSIIRKKRCENLIGAFVDNEYVDN